jgi:hypothetical protein
MNSSHEIPNERLRPEHLPAPEDDQMVWIRFALTFDGYAEKGTREECAAFANAVRESWERSGTLPGGLSDLRAALYYEQRRWRWSDEAPFTDREWRYWRSLVDAIRHVLLCADKTPADEITTPILQASDAGLAKDASEEAIVGPSSMEWRVELYSETDAHGGTRQVWLRLTEKGGLILEGLDLGEAPRKAFGTTEYEWGWSIAPERLGVFLKSLDVEATQSTDLLKSIADALKEVERAKIQQMFKEAGAEFWSWISP